MSSANFIPLGDVNRLSRFEVSSNDGPTVTSLSSGGQKTQGVTKEDRKRIAREARLAARKEKKKLKSDAKKQRKENAVQHRRMTRNNEKYSKNKDRNKQRSIDFERNKIRYDAVHQAERMAGKYDMSGKLFNVGEVVILPDGKVKSKAALQRIADEKAHKEALLKAKAEGKAAEGTIDGINPQRQGQISGALGERPKQRISKKQQKRQEMLAPKPVPPKPVLPEGYSLPEGEENIIALWDLTDEEILRRLANQKREKSTAAKRLRDAQKEKKKLNRAMKAMKKEAGNKGVPWDPEAARKEILGETKYLLPKIGKKKKTKDGSDSESESNSDSDSDSSSDSNDDSEAEWESDEEEKPKVDELLKQGGVDEKGNPIMTKNFPNRPKINLKLLKAAEDNERQLAERKRQARLKRKEDAKKKALEEAEAEERKKANEKNERKAARRAAKKEAEANGEMPIVAESPVVDEDEELVRKAAKKAEKAARKAEKAAVELPVEMEGVESTNGDSKKRKRSEDVEDADEVTETTKSKKSKKALVESNDSKLDALIAEQNLARLAQNKEPEPAPQYAEYEETHSHIANGTATEKRSKKNKPEKSTPVPEIDEEAISKAEEKQRKKEKKEKKAQKAVKQEAEAAATNGNGAEQWNPEALTGDDARKEKYLRLLGAKKGGAVTNGDKRRKESGSGKVDEIRKAESELERQFEAGIKLKHDGGGKRRGLGA